MKGVRSIVFLAVMLMTAACGIRQFSTTLDSVESCLQSHPDSALSMLRAIDTTALRTRLQRARYSLLHAMALDKNWIDTTDVDIVMPAVRYYDRHRPVSFRAKPYYYLGRIQYNGSHYDQAIVSFNRAQEYAENLNDDRIKALICQAISDTYNSTYLYEEALDYAKNAYLFDLLANDTLLANATLYRIAQLYNNLEKYPQADSLFALLSVTEIIHPQTKAAVLANYASLLASVDSEYNKAVRLFEQALSYKFGFNTYNQWGTFAYCLYKTGQTEKSEKIFRDMESAGVKEEFAYLYWRSRVEQEKGNYAAAYQYLDGASQKQTEGVMKLLRQSTIKAQRDYLKLENTSVKKEARQQRVIVFLLILLFLLLLVSVIYILKRYSERMIQQNQNLMETVGEMMALQPSNKEKENDIEQLRKEYFHLSQENFRELGNLCNSYYKTEGNTSQANLVCGEVRWYLKTLGIGGDRYSVLEKRVNEQFGQVMIHFREEHPNHREPFFQTACYLFAGFRIRTIALVLGRSEQNLYKDKSLLRKEIESRQTPHQTSFLTLLDGLEK